MCHHLVAWLLDSYSDDNQADDDDDSDPDWAGAELFCSRSEAIKETLE